MKFLPIVLPIIFFAWLEPGAHSANYNPYSRLYRLHMTDLLAKLEGVGQVLKNPDSPAECSKEVLLAAIKQARLSLKKVDFHLRYLDPIQYKKLNGPLPVEWEVEVYEKFARPYRREGAGLFLMEEYLGEKDASCDSLQKLLNQAVEAAEHFLGDSIKGILQRPEHFFFANRLFLLNCASIYTTGFENPDTNTILDELKLLWNAVVEITDSFESGYKNFRLTDAYKSLLHRANEYVQTFDGNYSDWDQFTFIKNYLNPLFSLNQQMIRQYHLKSYHINDYALTDSAAAIFSKRLFKAQASLGVFDRVADEHILTEIKETGRLLFYDPILSVNNQRACASCHKPQNHFTDTALPTAIHIDGKSRLARNIPDLLNVLHYHLLMHDGAQISVLGQAIHVMKNPLELGETEQGILEKIKSIPRYHDAFNKYTKYTSDKRYNLHHIASAVVLYYADFNFHSSAFEKAINNMATLSNDEIKGFNLFMGKAKCGTCHFPPLFNGNKPPYTSSEFEVIGTPSDTSFTSISDDLGRFAVYPSDEAKHAFRTPTLLNIARTKPYMHNGVFNSLDQVMDFYNHGGGRGKGLNVANQTLASDSLRLSATEINQIIAFLHSLNEDIQDPDVPTALPNSKIRSLNLRKPGGEF